MKALIIPNIGLTTPHFKGIKPIIPSHEQSCSGCSSSYLGLDGSRPALTEAYADATWENIPLPLNPLAYGSPVVVGGE
ncbi:hypothetical protein TSUD_208470 [Trifolium subterraneum]|uniref:Uncharacterized protein n=1 Tax=Trifolium subterraneum TaxID=3900 RepID=A0A2Z6N4E4_TRISU|nr:hypothetical protein TSUD_208470 [Trifolium subterraneum]